MKIAIFSDSHDRYENVAWALTDSHAQSAEAACHLGDYCSPPVAVPLAASPIPVYGVWGNCDGDKLLIDRRLREAGAAHVDIATTDFRELELGAKKIFLTHYPEIARLAALSGLYDAVFFGHNHLSSSETIHSASGKECLLANPGELAGTRTGTVSYGIYDTEANTFELVCK
jgi:hypothetical protein